MNVWMSVFYWSGQYPTGPNDHICRSSTKRAKIALMKARLLLSKRKSKKCDWFIPNLRIWWWLAATDDIDDCLLAYLIDWFRIVWLTVWLIDWLIDRLINWFNDWLLIDCLVDWFSTGSRPWDRGGGGGLPVTRPKKFFWPFGLQFGLKIRGESVPRPLAWIRHSDWLVAWLVGWLNDWLIDWLID